MTPSTHDEMPPSDELPEMVRVCTKHILENGDVLRMMRLVPVKSTPESTSPVSEQ